MSKVLIVDDVLVNRKLICKIVKNLDSRIKIYEAGNGREALRMMDETEFGVVILDVMMPHINGIEVLKIMKKERNYTNTSVIICSAINEIESVQEALDLGALDYFTKPLNTEQIKVTLPLKIRNAVSFYEQKKQLIQYNEMFKMQMQLAEELQRATIMEKLETSSVKMRGRYIPCDEIGGDMFAMKEYEDKNWFIIADVTGHGIAAAMMSTMIKVVFNYSVVRSSKPSEVLKILNDMLFEIFQKSSPPLITAFIGFIEGNKICFSNAGHPYPVLFKNTKSYTLEIPSFAIGFIENICYEDSEMNIMKDDFLVLYTDGLYDIGKIERYGNRKTIKTFIDDYIKHNNSLNKMMDELVSYFKGLDENGFDDDVALVVINKK